MDRMKDDLLWMYAGYILKVVMEGGVFLFVSLRDNGGSMLW